MIIQKKEKNERHIKEGGCIHETKRNQNEEKKTYKRKEAGGKSVEQCIGEYYLTKPLLL